MELRLPSALASIKEVADRSKALAQEVKDTFLVVPELIDETIMAVARKFPSTTWISKFT